MEQTQKSRKQNPWKFIPTQYVAEGLPYILVNSTAVVMFKQLGMSNSDIGMITSLITIPWMIKMFWSPWIDSVSTKRNWVVKMQLLLTACFAILAFTLQLPGYITSSIIILSLVAFLSATHDIVTDGFYLHALDTKQQAFFSGIRSTFWRLALILGGGLLVTMADVIGDWTGDINNGWSAAFAVSGFVFLVFWMWHKRILPHPETDVPVKNSDTNGKDSVPFLEAVTSYFKQPKITLIILFILFYRLGEGMLVKMAQPFLMDPAAAGGMNIRVKEIGIMYGTIGAVALVVGGILGGVLIKKYGLKKLIFPMALAMNLPNILYVLLAAFPTEAAFVIEIAGNNFHPYIQSVILLEQFGYGLGFTAFMVYLLYVSKGKYRTSHYAISTGIMAFGMMLPGIVSGFLQEIVGYYWLFVFTVLCAVPGIAIIFFLPYDEETS
ncbi:MAG: MFS transporter [Candidatus Kapabacteria bacterium]|jgi:PAT family beta-lactamase induction signal transducer AmpG|nr:MFS transporter [Candidatus Kapabacteria bacterium]